MIHCFLQLSLTFVLDLRYFEYSSHIHHSGNAVFIVAMLPLSVADTPTNQNSVLGDKILSGAL